jgi:hypothetical protein
MRYALSTLCFETFAVRNGDCQTSVFVVRKHSVSLQNYSSQKDASSQRPVPFSLVADSRQYIFVLKL